MTREKNFFEENGLEVEAGEVEVGKTYPIYGMITKILDDTPGSVIVELNFNITANLTVHEEDKIATLKKRAFEPGIFVSTIISKEDEKNIEVDCTTVVFGKMQADEQ